MIGWKSFSLAGWSYHDGHPGPQPVQERRVVTGFEQGEVVSSVSGSDFSIQQQYVRTGSYAGRIQAAAGVKSYWTIGIPSLPKTVFIRCYVMPLQYPTSGRIIIGTDDSILISYIYVRLNSNGTVSLLNGNTVIGTSTQVLERNAWWMIEVAISRSSGKAALRIDGQIVVDWQPVNTTTSYNNLYLGVLDTVNSTCDVVFDDIVVDTATWPGPGEVRAFVPNGPGSMTSSTFTANGASEKWDCLDEIPADTTTFVNTGTTTWVEETYTIPDIDSGIPRGIVVYVKHQRAGASNGGIIGGIRLRGQSRFGGSATTKESWAWSWWTTTHNVVNMTPLYGAWTKERLNALEIGIENASTNPSLVTSLLAEVDIDGTAEARPAVGRLLIESFEHRDLSVRYTVTGTAGVSTVQAATGTTSLRINPTGSTASFITSGTLASRAFFLKAAVFVATRPSSGNTVRLLEIGSGSEGCRLGVRMNDAGQLRLEDANGVRGSSYSSQVIPLNAWVTIEIGMLMSTASASSDGYGELRLNGESLQVDTAINTGSPGDARITLGTRVAPGSGGCDFFIDDVVVDATTWPGPTKVIALVPDGMGSQTASAFSAVGAATQIACLGEAPPDDDATYVYTGSPSATQQQSYTLPDLPSGVIAVYKVETYARARKDDGASTRLLTTGVRPGGAALDGASNLTGTTYSWYVTHHYYAVGYGSWTKALVDGTEAAIEVSSNGGQQRITALRVSVEVLTGQSSERTVDFTGTGVIRATQTRDLTGNGFIAAEGQKSFTTDGLVRDTFTKDLSGSALVKAAPTLDLLGTSVVFGARSLDVTANAVVLDTITKDLTASAYVVHLWQIDLAAQAVVVGTQAMAITAHALVLDTITKDLSGTGYVVATQTNDLSGSAVVFATVQRDVATDACVFATNQTTVSASGIVFGLQILEVTTTGIVVEQRTSDVAADALITGTSITEVAADGRVSTGLTTGTVSFDGSGYIKPPMQNSRSWTASALIASQEVVTRSFDATAVVRGPWIDILGDGYVTSGTLSGTVVALADGAWGGNIWYGSVAERIDGTTTEIPNATTPFVWTADTSTTITHLAVAVATNVTTGRVRFALEEMGATWTEKTAVEIPATSWSAASAPTVSWVVVSLPSAQTITAGTMYRIRASGDGPPILVSPTWAGSGLGANVVNVLVISTIPQLADGHTVLIAGQIENGILVPRDVTLDITATTGRLIIGLGGTLRYATGHLMVQSRCQINWGGSLVMEASSSQELLLGATATVELDGYWKMVGQPKTRFGLTSAPSTGTTMTLVDAPTGWTAGDQLYIASSSPSEGVFRTLTSVSGNSITLDASAGSIPAQSLIINTRRSVAVRSTGQAKIIWGQTGSCWWEHAEVRRCAGMATVAPSGNYPIHLSDVVFVEGREAGSAVGNEALVLPQDTTKLTLADLTIVRYVRGIITSTAEVTFGGITLCAGFLQDGAAIQCQSFHCVMQIVAQEIAGGVVGLGGDLRTRLVIPYGELRFGHNRAALVTVWGLAGSVEIQGGTISVQSGETGGVVALAAGGFLGELVMTGMQAPLPAVITDDGAYGLVNGRIRSAALTTQAPVRITNGVVAMDLVDEDSVYPERVSTFGGNALGTFAQGSRIADRDGTWTPRGEHRRSTTIVHSGTSSLEVAAFAGHTYELTIMVIPGTASEPLTASWWLFGTGEATFRLGTQTTTVTMTGSWSAHSLMVTPSTNEPVVFAVQLSAGISEQRCWIDEVIVS